MTMKGAREFVRHKGRIKEGPLQLRKLEHIDVDSAVCAADGQAAFHGKVRVAQLFSTKGLASAAGLRETKLH